MSLADAKQRAIGLLERDYEGVESFWMPGLRHLQIHREHIEAAVKESATT